MADDIITKDNLRNWYCPHCKEWLASCDVSEGQGVFNQHRKHIKCMITANVDVEWRVYPINLQTGKAF
jgi:hypothetical protein